MRAYRTEGETFALYLSEKFLAKHDARVWRDLEAALLVTNRSKHWAQAIREMACLHLTYRLIKAGSFLTKRYEDPVAEAPIKRMIDQTMYVSHREINDIYVRLLPAIQSSNTTIADGVRRHIRNHAKRKRRFCYLCAAEMDFERQNHHLSFSLDHVWPLAFGGESVEENLLGSCRSCNERKSDRPTWAMYPVQSLIWGIEFEDASHLPKDMRFAVQAREAVTESRNSDISLKDAYIRIGLPQEFDFAEGDSAVDIFGLTLERNRYQS